tara:strand:+ start:316 stop:648 length:333 start_codon:yes stop_codon:yes gene_type:complete
MKAYTRLEARILPEKDGMKNVVTELVVGMTYTDDDSGLSVYRDTLVSLPAPDEADFIAFEDIDEAWCLAIADKVAADNDWETSMTAEVEAAKSRPISKPFKFQEPKVEEA